jgi:hypothetical protein
VLLFLESFYRRLGGPRATLDTVGERNISCHSLFRFLDLSASSPVAIPTELPPEIKISDVGSAGGSVTGLKRGHNNTQISVQTHIYESSWPYSRSPEEYVTKAEVCLYSMVIGRDVEETIVE